MEQLCTHKHTHTQTHTYHIHTHTYIPGAVPRRLNDQGVRSALKPDIQKSGLGLDDIACDCQALECSTHTYRATLGCPALELRLQRVPFLEQVRDHVVLDLHAPNQQRTRPQMTGRVALIP